MALVMLPCDLPWWCTVYKKLNLVQECTELDAMLEHMQKIHDLCNVSLDPDDDDRTENVYAGLRTFVDTVLTPVERKHFLTKTIMNISRRAQSLKAHRPPRGLEFSLQQQSDFVEISYSLMAALLANAFFSTFPKRTEKTHPTLQDFNFTNFFKNLDKPCQQAKFRSIITYFDWIDREENLAGSVKISRKVMTGKQWLTIEDWLESNVPLCPLDIRHGGKIERTKPNFIQTVFVSTKLGSRVLYDGRSQECLHFSIFPEILPVLLHVEALEDNESLLIEDARQIGQIIDPLFRPRLEPLTEPRRVSLLLMDAENYSDFPIQQLEEDNILRELNKCLLAFSQKSTGCILEHRHKQQRHKDHSVAHRILLPSGSHSQSLSPIGENPSPVPKDVSTTIIVRQATSSTKRSSYDSEKIHNDIAGRRAWLTPDRTLASNDEATAVAAGPLVTTNGGAMMNGRRGRFIVLGSSGECLPVNRPPVLMGQLAADGVGSMYSSCDEVDSVDAKGDDDEDDEVYLSARESFENDENSADQCDLAKRIQEMHSPESRLTFAEKLQAALSQSDYSGSDGGSLSDELISPTTQSDASAANKNTSKMRRNLSTGFVLQEDSLDDEFYNESGSSDEKLWLDKYQSKLNGSKLKHSSSSYSFSTDCSSELDEIYDEFARWMDNDETAAESDRKLETRDEAIAIFASSLLKRTLSESFVGVKLTEGKTDSIPDEDRSVEELVANRKIRLILSSRSLSLELQKQKHRIAAHLKEKSSVAHNATGPCKKRSAKRSLRWSIAPVISQQTVNCEDVTLKLQLSQAKSYRNAVANVRPVATGNWGCGKSLNGDAQLKLIIQWLAASMAGLPCLMYYTAGHEKLTKLDTVCRVLLDRKWTVGALAEATLMVAQKVLDSPHDPARRISECFFEKFIGQS